MKLFFSPFSPYARKVMATAVELGLRNRIDVLDAAVSPIQRNPEVVAHNPAGKVPTLIADDGQAFYDSRVICEYLAGQTAKGATLFPAAGPARWTALRRQALADGLLDAALLARYETTTRPEVLRWADWLEGQLNKVRASVQAIEAEAGDFGDRVDIGTLAIACALGYLDLRYPHLQWRDGAPRAAAWFATFSQRPSLLETAPPAA